MFPQGFINKTLELIIDHGPMPFHDPSGKQVAAHPLTNSHRDVLRMLQKQGSVKIEYEGDELMVSYSGPPVPDKMFAALRSLPDRAIYLVPTEKRRQMAREYISGERAAGLWTGASVHVMLMTGTKVERDGELYPVAEGPRFMATIMSYHRPIFMDHRCVKSSASVINLRGYMDGLPDADDPYVKEEATRRISFWRFGDPARFHKPPPAPHTRGISRAAYYDTRGAIRHDERRWPHRAAS